MRRTVLAILLVIFVWPVASQAAILRVKAGGNGNGSSWSAALGSIDTAMNLANAGDEIWVAARPQDANGIYFYYESGTSTVTGIGEILVKDGVSMYGGFNGTETLRAQRDPKTNVTSLLLQIRIRMLQDKPTVIDGFKFINGIDMVVLIGDVGSAGTCQQLTISNNVFKNGGAPSGSIYAFQAPFTCSPTIQGNTFYPGSNPIYIPTGAPKILSNFFTELGATQREGITIGSGGNSSTGAVVANNGIWGMGVTIKSSGVLVANNTIAGGINGPNLSNMFGVITNGGSTVVNNIVAFYGNGIFAFDLITANHNLVYGNGANYVGMASPGAGDIQRDPVLVDRANGNLHLSSSSPAINAGDTSVVQAGWVDFDGFARVFPQSGLVDIGGSEYGSSNGLPTNTPPQVSAPTANPNPVTGQTTQLSVVATDSDNDTLSYQWALLGGAPAAVSFSNQAAATTGVTFSQAGSYTFQVTVNDGHGYSVTSAPVTVTVTIANISGTRTNVALASNGGVATASSSYNSAYGPSGTNNGDRKGLNWGGGGGWNDATANVSPDWLEVDFSGSKTINEVDVFSVQDNYQSPSDPTAAMTFNLYGLTDFQVQYLTGGQWVTVPGGTVSGNNLVWRQLTFSPLTTSAIRVWVTGALGGYSRITEVEAYSTGTTGVSVSLTSPTQGATYTAPVTIPLTASPTSSNSISKVDFFANGSPIGTANTSPYGISWSNVGAGSYTLTAVATDTTGATATSAPVGITVNTGTGTHTNVALASNGGVATASSSYSTAFGPSGTNDGDRKGLNWGGGGGWNDATANVSPDWLEVDFSGSKTINEVDVFTVQNNYQSPSDPTATMTFSLYGLTDFQVQYWTGSQWLTVPGGTVSGNNLVQRQVTFSPLTTSAIRVWVTGSLGGYSRITEIEAYTP